MVDFIKQLMDMIPPLSEFWMWLLAVVVCIFRVVDGWKYHIASLKIRRVKTAKSQSRFFIDLAAVSDIVLILWIIFKVKDTVLLVTGIIALFFVCELFYVTYLYYPYRCRGLQGFKRPNIFLYFVNSLLPNRIRKRL